MATDALGGQQARDARINNRENLGDCLFGRLRGGDIGKELGKIASRRGGKKNLDAFGMAIVGGPAQSVEISRLGVGVGEEHRHALAVPILGRQAKGIRVASDRVGHWQKKRQTTGMANPGSNAQSLEGSRLRVGDGDEQLHAGCVAVQGGLEQRLGPAVARERHGNEKLDAFIMAIEGCGEKSARFAGGGVGAWNQEGQRARMASSGSLLQGKRCPVQRVCAFGQKSLDGAMVSIVGAFGKLQIKKPLLFLLRGGKNGFSGCRRGHVGAIMVRRGTSAIDMSRSGRAKIIIQGAK